MASTTSPDAAGAAPAARRITVRCQFCQTWNRVDVARVADRPKCGSCSRPILVDRPFPLDDETFPRTIAESEVPVLVDFYADWCNPCKAMAPSVDELARRRLGEVLVAKLNTDLAPQTSQSFGIRSIPTVIVFRGGKEVTRQMGAVSMEALDRLAQAGFPA